MSHPAGKRNRRLPFDKSNPALPDWECTPRRGDVALDEFKVVVELGHSQFQIRTVASELGQYRFLRCGPKCPPTFAAQAATTGAAVGANAADRRAPTCSRRRCGISDPRR